MHRGWVEHPGARYAIEELREEIEKMQKDMRLIREHLDVLIAAHNDEMSRLAATNAQ